MPKVAGRAVRTKPQGAILHQCSPHAGANGHVQHVIYALARTEGLFGHGHGVHIVEDHNPPPNQRLQPVSQAKATEAGKGLSYRCQRPGGAIDDPCRGYPHANDFHALGL
jgi:hypothetical protein